MVNVQEDMTASRNSLNTTQFLNGQLNSRTTDSVLSRAADKPNIPAIATTVIFSVPEILTCGGLLLIFALRRNTAKHASMIMISTLVNICLGAASDLFFRIPLFFIKEKTMGKTLPKLCIALTLIPDYFMFAILLCLPLLSIERLIRLEAKKHLTTQQTRHLFGCLLVIAYSLALVIIILPATDLFSDDVNTKCGRHLLYGFSFAYVYTGLTFLSVFLTLIFSVAVIFRLKVKLSHLQTSMRRKIILKQGTVSAIVITGLLIVALVPFATTLQLVLMCGSNEVTNERFCDYILPTILFRTCIIVQKISLIALPLIFLKLNPTLRRKIWLTIKKPKQMENVVTISSNSVSGHTISKDSIYEDVSIADDLDDDFITIAEDLTFGKSGDVNGEIKRRPYGSVRQRQSVLDLVDVLSVISERSEISRSGSNAFSDTGE